MEKNLIQEKTFQFSLMIIEVYKKMLSQKEYIISKQIFRSGTGIGANVTEAQGSISKKEFRNKLSISLKEALETRYWFELITRSKIVELDLRNESIELESILNILYKIIKSTSANLTANTNYYKLNTTPVLGVD